MPSIFDEFSSSLASRLYGVDALAEAQSALSAMNSFHPPARGECPCCGAPREWDVACADELCLQVRETRALGNSSYFIQSRFGGSATLSNQGLTVIDNNGVVRAVLGTIPDELNASVRGESGRYSNGVANNLSWRTAH